MNLFPPYKPVRFQLDHFTHPLPPPPTPNNVRTLRMTPSHVFIISESFPFQIISLLLFDLHHYLSNICFPQLANYSLCLLLLITAGNRIKLKKLFNLSNRRTKWNTSPQVCRLFYCLLSNGNNMRDFFAIKIIAALFLIAEIHQAKKLKKRYKQAKCILQLSKCTVFEESPQIKHSKHQTLMCAPFFQVQSASTEFMLKK